MRMREAGMRPIQIWVPDVRTDKFAHSASQEARAINVADAREDIFTWLEESAVSWDEE